MTQLQAVVVTLLLSLLLPGVAGAQAPVDPPGQEDAAAAAVQPPGSLIKGTLIGMGAGALTAWVFTRVECGPARSNPECSVIAGLLGLAIFVPAGGVAGALINRAIRHHAVSPPPAGTTRATTTVSPWIAKRGGGVALSVVF
jgi:hypothetical protein